MNDKDDSFERAEPGHLSNGALRLRRAKDDVNAVADKIAKRMGHGQFHARGKKRALLAAQPHAAPLNWKAPEKKKDTP